MMNKLSINKRFALVTGVFGLLCLLIGVSYAVWNYMFIGNVNKLESYDISIELLESNENLINIENALPMSYSDGKAQEDTFDFAVTSKTRRNMNIYYTIKIEKLEVDATYTSLADNQIALYLTDFSDNALLEGRANNDKASSENVLLVSQLPNYSLYKGVHEHNSSKETVQDKYKLRAWIDESVDASGWTASTKMQYKFKIGLYATELEHAKTVLYNDGTLIINEPLSKRSANTALHGAVTNEYVSYGADSNYNFSSSSIPWNKQRSNIRKVEVGQKIQPTSTSYWLYLLPNLEYGDFTLLDTSKVTSMDYMFSYCATNTTSLSLIGLDTWDVSKVENMSWMFYGMGYNVSNFSLDLSSWNVKSVTNAGNMFYYAFEKGNNISLNLSDWKFNSDVNMNGMFYRYGVSATGSYTLNLSNWSASKITNVTNMFMYCADNNVSSFSLNVTNWNLGNTTNLSSMFNAMAEHANSVEVLGLNTWDVSKITNMIYMFRNVAYTSTTLNSIDLSSWDVSHVTNTENMFANVGTKVTNLSLNLSTWDVSNVTNMSEMFSYFGNISNAINLNISNWKIPSSTVVNSMFNNAGSKCPSFNLNLSNWNTSVITDMSKDTMIYKMFHSFYLESGSKINLNLSNWNTSNVTNMNYLFNYFGSNASEVHIDVKNWDVSKVTDMNNMFSSAGSSSTSFSINNLSTWRPSSVENMGEMFNYTGYLAPTWSIGDLSSWNTSSVQNMGSMFYYAGHASTVFNIGNLSGWDTTNVQNMGSMFYGAGETATTWSIGTFNIRGNSNLASMFSSCTTAKATINIYSNPSSFSYMFYSAATASGSLITVNYSNSTTNIDNIIATKSSTSNVVKGTILS